MSDFPSFKIVRLAIDKRFQKKGYGKHILFWALWEMHNLSKKAARYVTVDSEPDSLEFYKKYAFTENLHQSHNKPKRSTISLRFDLHELTST